MTKPDFGLLTFHCFVGLDTDSLPIMATLSPTFYICKERVKGNKDFSGTIVRCEVNPNKVLEKYMVLPWE